MSVVKKKDQKQVCWHCEGGVDVGVTQCPYCGVDLTSASAVEVNEEQKSTYRFVNTKQQGLESLSILNPPYMGGRQGHSDQENVMEDSGWEEKDSEEPFVNEDLKQGIKPLLLLLPGSVFLVFSLFLFLFSHNGVFILKWNSFLWPFYFLASLPLLYYGWRTLNKINDEKK